MKRFLITSLVFFILFFSPAIVLSEERLAECDACGYCRGQSVSDDWIKNWEKCRDCLYDVPKAIPTLSHTLLVVTPTADPSKPLTPEEKDEFARPIKPIPGRYYTQLGCIDTSLSTFQDPAAAGGLLNFLLTRLIFPVAGVLGFLALLYGAFLLITAQGNSMQIQIGKSYVIGAIVGLIFVFSSILLVSLIGGDILKIPWLSRGTETKIQVRGEAATEGGKLVYPEFAVQVDGKNVLNRTLGLGDQDLKINLPVKLNLEEEGQLARVSFYMANGACYSISSIRNSTCCDPGLLDSLPPNHERRAQCADRKKYHGDTNMYVSGITID